MGRESWRRCRHMIILTQSPGTRADTLRPGPRVTWVLEQVRSSAWIYLPPVVAQTAKFQPRADDKWPFVCPVCIFDMAIGTPHRRKISRCSKSALLESVEATSQTALQQLKDQKRVSVLGEGCTFSLAPSNTIEMLQDRGRRLIRSHLGFVSKSLWKRI